MAPAPDLRDRIAGALVGLLVGDALGVPYEFNPPERIPPASQIEYTPPRSSPRRFPRDIGTQRQSRNYIGEQAVPFPDSGIKCLT